MRFVIVTGMSGAGKSSAMKILEDDGFFCVDNLPVSLLATFIELTEGSSEPLERVALGLDIRAGHNSLAEAGDRVLEKGRLYAGDSFYGSRDQSPCETVQGNQENASSGQRRTDGSSY